MGENLCTNQTLQQNVAKDIEGKFPGVGPATAQCCNWTLCNLNSTFAALTEAPSMESSTESDQENSALKVIFSKCMYYRGLVRNRKFWNVLFWHRGGIRRLVLRGFSLAGPGNAARRPFCGPGMATDWRGGIIDFQQFFQFLMPLILWLVL